MSLLLGFRSSIPGAEKGGGEEGTAPLRAWLHWADLPRADSQDTAALALQIHRAPSKTQSSHAAPATLLPLSLILHYTQDKPFRSRAEAHAGAQRGRLDALRGPGGSCKNSIWARIWFTV